MGADEIVELLEEGRDQLVHARVHSLPGGRSGTWTDRGEVPLSRPRDTVRARVRGLYALVDGGLAPDPEAHGRRLIAAGVRLLQLRWKEAPPDELLRVARALAPVARAAGCTFLVNDQPEVARAADADGVHVGQTDGAPAAVRAAVGEGRIVGRSTGADTDPALLVDADYLAFGPVFDTPRLSRPKAVVGLDGLRCARARDLRPLVAIGGITADNVAHVRAAGADAWAVIGALHGADPEAAVRSLA